MKKEVKVAGQIFQQAEDSWTVRIYLGRNPGTGKRRYLNRTVRGRKKDAQRVLNELLHAKDLGRLVEPSRMTLSDYLDEWLEVSARQRLRVRTLTGCSSTATCSRRSAASACRNFRPR